VLRICSELRRHDDVRGQDDPDSETFGFSEIAAHGIQLVGFQQAGPDRMPPCGEEREKHSTTDQQGVDTRQEVTDDSELVGDLRTAEDNRIRRLRGLGEAIEHIQFGSDEQTGGARQDRREVVDARLLAMHDTESVRDNCIAESCKLRRERLPFGIHLARLPRVEAEVFEHDDVTVGELGNGIHRRGTHCVGRKRHWTPHELTEPRRNRRQAVASVEGTLRAAEVRDDYHTGALSQKRIQGRQRRPHAAVVGDLPVF